MEDTLVHPVYSVLLGGWLLYQYGTEQGRVLVKRAEWNHHLMRTVEEVEGPAVFDKLENVAKFLQHDHGYDLAINVGLYNLQWVPMGDVSFEVLEKVKK